MSRVAKGLSNESFTHVRDQVDREQSFLFPDHAGGTLDQENPKSFISKRYIMPGQILVQFWSNSGSTVSVVTTQRPPPPTEAEKSLETGRYCGWTEIGLSPYLTWTKSAGMLD